MYFHLIIGIVLLILGGINTWIYGHQCGVRQERLTIQVHRNGHYIYAEDFQDLSEFKILENNPDTNLTLRGKS